MRTAEPKTQWELNKKTCCREMSPKRFQQGCEASDLRLEVALASLGTSDRTD